MAYDIEDDWLADCLRPHLVFELLRGGHRMPSNGNDDVAGLKQGVCGRCWLEWKRPLRLVKRTQAFG